MQLYTKSNNKAYLLLYSINEACITIACFNVKTFYVKNKYGI